MTDKRFLIWARLMFATYRLPKRIGKERVLDAPAPTLRDWMVWRLAKKSIAVVPPFTIGGNWGVGRIDQGKDVGSWTCLADRDDYNSALVAAWEHAHPVKEKGR